MRKFLMVLALIASSNANANGYLEAESTNGSLRYCRYSDGVILTVNLISMCPMSSGGQPQQQQRPRYNALEQGCNPNFPATCGKTFNPNAYDNK